MSGELSIDSDERFTVLRVARALSSLSVVLATVSPARDLAARDVSGLLNGAGGRAGEKQAVLEVTVLSVA